nr:unnamed protein product [Digitaria exilis]
MRTYVCVVACVLSFHLFAAYFYRRNRQRPPPRRADTITRAVTPPAKVAFRSLSRCHQLNRSRPTTQLQHAMPMVDARSLAQGESKRGACMHGAQRQAFVDEHLKHAHGRPAGWLAASKEERPGRWRPGFSQGVGRNIYLAPAKWREKRGPAAIIGQALIMDHWEERGRRKDAIDQMAMIITSCHTPYLPSHWSCEIRRVPHSGGHPAFYFVFVSPVRPAGLLVDQRPAGTAQRHPKHLRSNTQKGKETDTRAPVQKCFRLLGMWKARDERHPLTAVAASMSMASQSQPRPAGRPRGLSPLASISTQCRRGPARFPIPKQTLQPFPVCINGSHSASNSGRSLAQGLKWEATAQLHARPHGRRQLRPSVRWTTTGGARGGVGPGVSV